MKIFETKGTITLNDNKTNISHCFQVPSGLKALTIKYEYSPKIFENRHEAATLIRECFEKYDEKMQGPPVNYLPVKNLITLSLDDSSKYRGAAHRQDSKQEHIISEKFASPGFESGEIINGQWVITLNVHYVSCDVFYEIVIEGEQNELSSL